MEQDLLKYQQLNVVIVGHVDHGKSTLIGRLLYDTDSLPDGKYEEIEKVSKKRGTEAVEWSYILDAFQAERDQAVTIDTTQIRFASDQRDYVIIDAPGHKEFLKNMISGAASADAAILVVDAKEGVKEQTKRHAYLLHLLGMKQVGVVINKMDLVDYDAERFHQLSKQIESYLSSIGVPVHTIIPLSARHGDMINQRGDHLSWYQGKNLIELLDSFEVSHPSFALPLRFPVQDVYREDTKRILVGRIETGTLQKGDKIYFSPNNEHATVTSIEVWPKNEEIVKASAGDAIGITLDEKIFVERGHVGSHDTNLPMLSNVFRLNTFWFSDKPLKVGNSYKIRYATSESLVTVQSINKVVNTDTLERDDQTQELAKNEVGDITFRARDTLPIDPFADNQKLGRLVIYDGFEVAGGGNINMDGYPDQRQTRPKSENLHAVNLLTSYQERAQSYGHYGAVFWLTGLSGAGKSTLALAVEKKLFEKNYKSYVLDGDNVRHGLCADLGFSPEDRAENIRRVGHVAALHADAGLVTISAFISPYQADRDKARAAAPDRFHEVYIKADLKTCEDRDPKGLYQKARKGEIKDFTGIDSPYEEPVNPDLIVDTKISDIDTCVEQIVHYIEQTIQVKTSQADLLKEKVLETLS